MLRHQLVTGNTGGGKSGYLLSLILHLLTRARKIGVVLVDGKGESAQELVDHFLPALVEGYPHLDPEKIVVIRPFGQYGVKLNPLTPVPDLAPEVQAHLVCQLLGRLGGDEFRPRMLAILSGLSQAVIAIRGTLLDVLRLLRDPCEAESFAPRIAHPELRQYLLTTFPQEPAASRDALRARLEWLLLVPSVRAMLCADSCLSGAQLLEAMLTIVDLGGAPQGCLPLAHFVGELLLSRLSGAIFARKLPAHHVVAVVDEWQVLVQAAGAGEVERLLAQARFRRASLVLANQTLAQIAEISPALVRSLLTNISVHLAFRPDPALDIKHLLPLLSVTGRTIDPDYPDRLLSVDAERRRLLERLARLPPRHALLGDLVAGRAEVIKTLDVPFEEARRRASQLDRQTRERFRQGRHGVPFADLINLMNRSPGELAGMPTSSIQGQSGNLRGTPSAVKRSRTGRPPLVLP